jgi:glutamine synthetase
LNVEGINAEVATGQWEFQIFAKGAKAAGDQVWVARYLLERIGEKYGSLSTGIANLLVI